MKNNLEDIFAIKHIQRFLADLPRHKKNGCVSLHIEQLIVLIRPLVRVEVEEVQSNWLLSGKEIAVDLLTDLKRNTKQTSRSGRMERSYLLHELLSVDCNRHRRAIWPIKLEN